MATRYVCLPENARPNSTAMPQPLTINTTERVQAYAFDAAAVEQLVWAFVAPSNMVGPWTAIVTYVMATATSGAVVCRGYFEAITSGDAINLNTTTSYDSANQQTDTVPGSVYNPKQFTITMTNDDAITAGDWVCFRFDRFATDAGDTAAGDMLILSIELRDSA